MRAGRPVKVLLGLIFLAVLAFGGLHMADRLGAQKPPGTTWISLLASMGALPQDIASFPGWTGLVRRSTGNDALVCPPGRCSAPHDFEAPEFQMAREALLRLVTEIALGEPRTVRLPAVAGNEFRVDFQQASAAFRFPDVISVEVFPTPAGGSTLALWSRSVVGRKDFGVNHARLAPWIEKLKAGATASR